MSLLQRVSDAIDRFTAENEAFKEACDRAFADGDKDANGKLSPTEVASKVDAIFQEMDDILAASMISVQRPTEQEVKYLLEDSDINDDRHLDREEFTRFYNQILKLAAYNASRGFVTKHGPTFGAAFASAFALGKGWYGEGIPDGLKPYVIPFASVVGGLLARYGFTARKHKAAEKKLFRSAEFQKSEGT